MIRKGPWTYIDFTLYDDLLFKLDEDPGEPHDRSRAPEAQAALRDLRETLTEEVDPEAAQCAGFDTQSRMLAGFASKLGETGLATLLQGRMGTGPARVLVAHTVSDLARQSA